MAEEKSQTPATTRRRGWSVTIRGLMLAVMILGSALGWLVHTARVQRDAVAAIVSAHGEVLYDWQMPASPGSPAVKSPVPRWLVEWVGIDYFATVAAVEVRTNEDSIMSAVGRLGHLRELTLEYQACANGRLARIARLTDLRKLDLISCEIEERDLVFLRDLVRLESLKLNGSGIMDSNLASLAGMTNMRMLCLTRTSVEGAGLAHLAAMERLDYLCVDGPRFGHFEALGRKDVLTELHVGWRVTDADLDALSNFPKLAVLGLEGTDVGDAGVARLRGRTNLKTLLLKGTRVTDAALDDLATLTGCSLLNLEKTRITDAGVAKLKAIMPQTTIFCR